MPATLNLHRVFSTQEGYLHALRVRDEDDAMLRTSREEIRAALRGAFAAWPTFVAKVQLFDHEALAKSTDAAPKLPQPKFRIQGSFAYFTANDCQHPPLQQIDQDDGVFLPVSFLMNGGGGAAVHRFERLLRARRKGSWAFVRETRLAVEV